MIRRNLLALALLPTAALAQQATPVTPTAPTPPAQVQPLPASPGNLPEAEMSLSTLDALHKKGLLSDAEYDAALSDLRELGARAKNENTLVVSKFAATLYGFAEGEFTHDDTRSFLDLPGGGAIARPGSLGASSGRTIFSVRNSRIGFRLGAPEFNGIRASAQLEMDFLGNQPASPPKNNGFAEGGFFSSPTFRIRHMLVKLDSDVVNLWVGQTWNLVGFQGGNQPATVTSQGIPGELYARNAQIRLDKTIKAGPVAAEVSVAAIRPPQMDSELPAFEGGLKLSLPGYTGVQSAGQTSTAIVPASIAVSGGVRQVKLPTDATGLTTDSATGHIIAADLLIPIIPAKKRQPWALTLMAEGAVSTGEADQYTGFNGGAGVGTPPGAVAADYAKVANIDPGLAGWSSATGKLGTVDWRSVLVSAQLYLPGNTFVSSTYSNVFSGNVQEFGSPKSTFNHLTYFDVDFFADVTPALRYGVEYSHYSEHYLDGVQANDNRFEVAGFFIF